MPDLDVAIPSRLAGDGPWPSSGDGRAIVRRRSLPGSRAVIGGFLIAAAAVITFGAYTGATRPARQLYVVAARQLAPGTRMDAADLRVAALDLPDPAVRHEVFGSVSELVGASVLAPIAPGSLIEASEVVGRRGAPGTREISVSVASSRAVGGTLKPGEFVDVLSTFGQGAASETVAMVPHVEVLDVTAEGAGSVGSSTGEVIVLAVPDGTTAEAVADADAATQLTLVRSAEQLSDAPVTTIPPFRPSVDAGGS